MKDFKENINQYNLDSFSRRAQGMYSRLTDLYENLGNIPVDVEILPQAIFELGSASEIVHVATQELYQQNEELITTRNLLESERQRYQNLFDFAPDAYLVTDEIGMIQAANRAATKLLNTPYQQLKGKGIINYITLQSRQTLRNFLTQPYNCEKKQLVLQWKKRGGEVFNGACSVGAVCNQQGKPIALHWLIREISDSQDVELRPSSNASNLNENRNTYNYCKGETVTLNPNAIWLVNQGWIKLSTICETGEEVVVGFAVEGMVFGSILTALQTYQATALSDVNLSSISLAEINASSTLSQTILPKINQRLRQTESFLAICGRRRVEDRFCHLLQLLAKEIGEPVIEGIRLSVRLTHEDLANTCCTTRVTITRLLGKLHKQGMIYFDSKNHIIVKHI